MAGVARAVASRHRSTRARTHSHSRVRPTAASRSVAAAAPVAGRWCGNCPRCCGCCCWSHCWDACWTWWRPRPPRRSGALPAAASSAAQPMAEYRLLRRCCSIALHRMPQRRPPGGAAKALAAHLVARQSRDTAARAGNGLDGYPVLLSAYLDVRARVPCGTCARRRTAGCRGAAAGRCGPRE